MSNDSWQTPSHIIEMARKVMGSINFDPASSREANETVKADRFCQIDDITCKVDGLKCEWPVGNIWLNPPFSRGNPMSFVSRLEQWWNVQPLEESQAILLTNNDTETLWFQKALDVASSNCFPRGRIAFINPETGQPAKNNRQGQTLFYLGFRDNEFCKEFSKIGFVI